MARPVAFVGATGQSYPASPGTQVVLSVPSGVQQNDVLIAVIVRNRDEHDAGTPGFLTLTGPGATWQIPDSRGDSANYADGGNPLPGWATRFCVAWRVASASEPATYTFDAAATPDNIRAGVMLAYRYTTLQWDDDTYATPPYVRNSNVASSVGSAIPGVPDGRLLIITSRGTPSYTTGTQRVTASGSSGATTCYVSVADVAMTSNANVSCTVSGGSTGPSPEVTRLMTIPPENHPPAIVL